MKIHKQQIKYNIKESEDDIVAAAKENATLFVGTTYALASTFRQLEVAAYVKLVAKQPNGEKPKVLYKNNFYFINRLQKPNHNTKANKLVWTRNSAALLKAKLRDAALLISRMIAMDIAKPNAIPYRNPYPLVKLRAIDGFKKDGVIIKRQKGYYIVYLVTKGEMNGYLYAVNSDDLVRRFH